jgi:8-oxo-dGTP pyrophosphatase MutT (NUDIX family)
MAASREVWEETGLKVSAERVAFVLETNSWDGHHHVIDLVFLGLETDPKAVPRQFEDHLVPRFVGLDELEASELMPPLAGYIKGFPRERSSQLDWQLGTAPWLGNLWRAEG